MNEQDFLKKMLDILDTEKEINMQTTLVDLEEWDSLSFVSFLAAMSEYSSKRIAPLTVREALTLGDLYALVK